MHIRNKYIEQILLYQQKPLIKIITGMRRVGKSVILQQVIDHIQQQEPSATCIYINKEDLAFEFISSYQELNHYVTTIKTKAYGHKRYVFIDEIQDIEQWEKAVNSLFSSGNYDIYITGSNAHLLSSELATLLSGRYVEIPVYPLSFLEFAEFKGLAADASLLQDYIRFGGLPVLHHMEMTPEIVYPYLNALWNTILLNDIVKRYQIRNVELLIRIARFAFDNIGHTFSAKSISDYLKSQQLKVGVDTVQNYLHYLASTYVLNKVSRYDIHGKRHLEVYEEYFLGDIALRHALLHSREGDITGIIENIVYLELKQRGYSVSIGKLRDLEIDFIAEKAQQKIYIQVVYLLSTPEVIEREIKPLLKIQDNYPKWVISLDDFFGTDIKGIRRIHLLEFLTTI